MFFFFFFNDTATTEIYTLSLHDALPISIDESAETRRGQAISQACSWRRAAGGCRATRSEEHTSELQSQSNLVCRLLLEKKKTTHAPPRVPRDQPSLRRSLRSSRVITESA